MDKQHTAIRTAGNIFVASGIIQPIAAAVCMFTLMLFGTIYPFQNAAVTALLIIGISIFYFFGNYSITLGCNLYDIIDDSLGEEIESLEYNWSKAKYVGRKAAREYSSSEFYMP